MPDDVAADAAPPRPAIRRIGIIGQSRYGDLAKTVRAVAACAAAHGLGVSAEERIREFLPDAEDFRAEDVDLLLTLGGDGTLLRGARVVAPFGTPVLGVNLGYLGFLTSIGPADIEATMGRVLAGDFWLDERMTLEAAVQPRRGPVGPMYLCLNDAVLHKGGFARVIRLAVRIGEDEDPIATYSADGLILSTPTGSTAYSLSAGGAIVVPTVECILATPICPHTLALRPLIVPAATVLSVEVLSPAGELVLTVDGQDGEALQPGDRLVVRRGSAVVRLVRLEGQSFFDTLRRKLHWSIGQRR